MDAPEIRRGEIYFEDVSRYGGALQKVRPVLVVQNDAGNRYSADVVVVAIRDARRERMLPVFVPVRKGAAGLAKDSIVDTAYLSTIPKTNLRWRLGVMSSDIMERVDRALHISLGLKS